MKDKIKKLLPFICFFFLFLFLHHFMNYSGDDIWFKKELTNKSILEFLQFRYNNWSSRLLIETVLVITVRNSIHIWRFLDSLLYTLTVYYMIDFVNPKKRKSLVILGLSLALMYPYLEMSDAGWAATTLNYSWCFAGAIFSFIPIIKKYRKENVSIFNYILSILGLLYAVNQEQVCALVFGINILFILNSIIKKEKINKYSIFVTIICFMSLLFIILCPGNSSRTLLEIASKYPEYKKYGIIQKTYLGIIPTINILLSHKFVISILYILLSFLTLNKTKNVFFKYLSYINIVFILSITVFRPTLLNLFPRLEGPLGLFELDYLPRLWSRQTLITIALSLYILFNICLMLYIIYGKENLFPLIFFMAAFMSRFIIGFSPTVFASGPRTAFFLNMMLIMLILMLINKLYDEKRINDKWERIIIVSFIVIAIYSYVNTFIVI